MLAGAHKYFAKFAGLRKKQPTANTRAPVYSFPCVQDPYRAAAPEHPPSSQGTIEYGTSIQHPSNIDRTSRGDGEGKPSPWKCGLGGLEGFAFEAVKQFQPHS